MHIELRYLNPNIIKKKVKPRNKITIGEFTIADNYPAHGDFIGIYSNRGEGGEFSGKDFEEVIRKFYEENF